MNSINRAERRGADVVDHDPSRGAREIFPALGRLGLVMVQTHHEFDPQALHTADAADGAGLRQVSRARSSRRPASSCSSPSEMAKSSATATRASKAEITCRYAVRRACCTTS